MAPTIHRADKYQEYLDRYPDDPIGATKRFKAECPEYFPAHFDKGTGEPRTFEGAVSRNIRRQGMTPDAAIRTATARYPHLQRDYYERLQINAVADLDFVLAGGKI